MSVRAEKVASVIKRALTSPISELAHEYSAGLVTITSVRLSNDLQIAKVYLSLYNSKISQAKFISLLEDKNRYLRSVIGSSIRLRQTPELRFYIDDTLNEMEHIQKLLDSVKSKTETNENNL